MSCPFCSLLGPFGADSRPVPDTDQTSGTGISGLQAVYTSTDPIGLQGSPGATPLQGGAKKGGATATIELNIVGGAFDWDPPITDAEEIAKLNGNLWSPGTKDFVAVVNGVSVTATRADSFSHQRGSKQLPRKGRTIIEATGVDLRTDHSYVGSVGNKTIRFFNRIKDLYYH
jgi:hypothetical protein